MEVGRWLNGRRGGGEWRGGGKGKRGEAVNGGREVVKGWRGGGEWREGCGKGKEGRW